MGENLAQTPGEGKPTVEMLSQNGVRVASASLREENGRAIDIAVEIESPSPTADGSVALAAPAEISLFANAARIVTINVEDGQTNVQFLWSNPPPGSYYISALLIDTDSRCCVSERPPLVVVPILDDELIAQRAQEAFSAYSAESEPNEDAEDENEQQTSTASTGRFGFRSNLKKLVKKAAHTVMTDDEIATMKHDVSSMSQKAPESVAVASGTDRSIGSAKSSFPRILVHAGSHRVAFLGRATDRKATLRLHGRVFMRQSDAAAGSITFKWTVLSRPHIAKKVAFEDDTVLDPMVTFTSAFNLYDLQLAAIDAATGETLAIASTSVRVLTDKQLFGLKEVSEAQMLFEQRDLLIGLDPIGLDWNRLKERPRPAGDAGEALSNHPRILVRDWEREDLRARVAGSYVGSKTLELVRNTVEAHLFREDHPWHARFDKAANGGKLSKDEALEAYWNSLLAYEAFLSWFDGDSARRERVAKAIGATAAAMEREMNALDQRAKQLAEQWGTENELFIGYDVPDSENVEMHKLRHDYRLTYQEIVNREFVPLAYDFAYGAMSGSDRQTVQRVLQQATSKDKWIIGMDAPPVGEASTSNWTPSHVTMMLLAQLALEQTVGFNRDTYQRCVAAFERFLTIGMHSDGSPAEGMGKNQIMGDLLVALARRGEHFIASHPVRNHARAYLLHSAQPFAQREGGKLFTFSEQLGGSFSRPKIADIAALAYAYPDDPCVQAVYRMVLQDDLSAMNFINDRVAQRTILHIKFPYTSMHPMLLILFASPTDRAVFERPFGDVIRDCASAAAAAAAEAPPAVPPGAAMGSGLLSSGLGQWSNEHGRLVLRSSWSLDAAQLVFVPRAEHGGHAHDDRNKIAYTSHGVVWALDTGEKNQLAVHHGVLFMGKQRPSCASQARTVSVCDGGALGAFATADAKLCYEHAFGGFSAPDDFCYTPAGGYTQLWRHRRAITLRGGMCEFFSQRCEALPYLHKDSGARAVKRALRTAGLIRVAPDDDRAAALVVDDVCFGEGGGADVDDNESIYFEWSMPIQDELKDAVSLDGEAIECNGDARKVDVSESVQAVKISGAPLGSDAELSVALIAVSGEDVSVRVESDPRVRLVVRSASGANMGACFVIALSACWVARGESHFEWTRSIFDMGDDSSAPLQHVRASVGGSVIVDVSRASEEDGNPLRGALDTCVARTEGEIDSDNAPIRMSRDWRAWPKDRRIPL